MRRSRRLRSVTTRARRSQIVNMYVQSMIFEAVKVAIEIVKVSYRWYSVKTMDDYGPDIADTQLRQWKITDQT